jgi:hypothetical protein
LNWTLLKLNLKVSIKKMELAIYILRQELLEIVKFLKINM